MGPLWGCQGCRWPTAPTRPMIGAGAVDLMRVTFILLIISGIAAVSLALGIVWLLNTG